MNANEMLDLIGGVKGSYIEEAQRHREERVRGRSPLKIFLIAAIMTVLLAGCAYAVLKLQDLKMGTYVPVPMYEGETFAEEDFDRSILSLQGYMGSPEYQAAKEWVEFEQSYQPDQSEILSTDGHDFMAPDRYAGYTVYTQAMMDKVDEICEKYGLDTLGKIWFEENEETEFIFEAVDIPGILAPGVEADIVWDNGTYFEAGTFEVNGIMTRKGADSPVEVSYHCVKKGIFDNSYTLVNMDQYEDWEYTRKDGTKVLMVMGQFSVRIIADQKDCFINVWVGSEEKPSRQTAEALAELFDFDIQPKQIPIEVLQNREKAHNAEVDKGIATGMACYDDAVAKVWSHHEHPEWLSYTIMDLDNNGIEELVIGQDGFVQGIFTLIDDEVFLIHSGYEIFPVFGGMPDYIYENGVIGQPGSYFQMMPRLVPTKGEHKRVIVDMLPLSMYPLEQFPDIDPEFWDRKNNSRKFTSLAEYAEACLDYDGEYSYALMDLDNDGQLEMIQHCDMASGGWVLDGIYTVENGHVKKLLLEPFPETICQGGIIESVIDCGQGNFVYRYFRVEEGKLVMVDYLRLDNGRDPENPWFHSTDGTGQDISLEPITKEEFDAIRSQYVPLGLEMKPMTEFPME